MNPTEFSRSSLSERLGHIRRMLTKFHSNLLSCFVETGDERVSEWGSAFI